MWFVKYLPLLLLWSIPLTMADKAYCSVFQMSSLASCHTVRYFIPKTIRMAMVPGRSQALQPPTQDRDPSVLDCIHVQLGCKSDSEGLTSCHNSDQSIVIWLNGTINGTLMDLKVCLDETLQDRCTTPSPMLYPGRTYATMTVNFRKANEDEVSVDTGGGCSCEFFEKYHENQIDSCYKENGLKRKKTAWFAVAVLMAVFGGCWLVYYGTKAAMGRAKRRRFQRERTFMTRSIGPSQTHRF